MNDGNKNKETSLPTLRGGSGRLGDYFGARLHHATQLCLRRSVHRSEPG